MVVHFFYENPYNYAGGLEKAYNAINQGSDASLLDVMSLGHTGTVNNALTIDTEANIAASLGSYRGALVGTFGLLRNGVVDQGNTSKQGEYTIVSGRSIIGNKSDGTFVFACLAGVSGSTGITGAQAVTLAQNLGLYNALCLDGGGSVGLVYDDNWKVQSVRLVKNALAIYVKTPIPAAPSVPSLPTKPWSFINVGGTLKQITSAKVMVGGVLKDVPRIYDRVGGVNKLIFEKEISSANFPRDFGTTYTWSTTTPTTATTSLASTNNPHIASWTSSNFGKLPPSAAFDGDGTYYQHTGSNGFTWPMVWNFTFNSKIAFNSMTVTGWGSNNDYLSSPASTLVQGSNDGTNWTSLFDGVIPNSWAGDSMNWGISGSYSLATQQAGGGADANVGWGPLGDKTITFAYNTTFFRYLRITWRTNWEFQIYGTKGADDLRKYWNAPYDSYDYNRSNDIAFRELFFQC